MITKPVLVRMQVPVHTRLMRQGNKQGKNLYLYTPLDPDGLLVGQCQDEEVAAQICLAWNAYALEERSP